MSVSESASVGTSFLLPSATDLDSPRYGVQRYQLLNAQKQFSLRVTNKLDGFLDVRLVLRRRLDRETTDLYRLILAAFDGGQPALHWPSSMSHNQAALGPTCRTVTAVNRLCSRPST